MNNKYTIIKPFDKYGYNAIHTTKDAKNMKDKQNLVKLIEELKLSDRIIAYGNQTHSINVISVNKNTDFANLKDIDGIVTDDDNLVLVTYYADCLPIFLLDTTKNVYGILHAGWRGSVNKILQEGIKLMKNEYGCDTDNIVVSFGVCINPKVYEIGYDTFEYISSILEYDNIFRFENNKIYLDIQAINYNIAVENGIKEQNIFKNDYCSMTGNYHSHRRDKDGTRSAAIMYRIKNEKNKTEEI